MKINGIEFAVEKNSGSVGGVSVVAKSHIDSLRAGATSWPTDAQVSAALGRKVKTWSDGTENDVEVIYADVYTYSTDAVKNATVAALAVDAAVDAIVAQGEWAPLDSKREERDLADGAWLTVFDAAGVPVLRRGVMP